MGASTSKRIEKSVGDSAEFTTACESVYQETLGLAQHAFPGIRPYQLLDASNKLHHKLSAAHPLIKKWVPSPPNQNQVDTALSTRFTNPNLETLHLLDFKAFAVELFKELILGNARKILLQRVPIGVVGIAGIGMATRSGKQLVASAIGVYALGLATAVYLSIST